MTSNVISRDCYHPSFRYTKTVVNMHNFEKETGICLTTMQWTSGDKPSTRVDLEASYPVQVWRCWHRLETRSLSMPQSKSIVRNPPARIIAPVDYFLKDFRASKESLSTRRISYQQGGDAADSQCRDLYQPNR